MEILEDNHSSSCFGVTKPGKKMIDFEKIKKDFNVVYFSLDLTLSFEVFIKLIF